MSGADSGLPIPARMPAGGLPLEPRAAGDLDPSILPSRVMASSLILWGAGHWTMGDRRGGLLLALEVAWLAALAVALPLLQTDRWILVFALLAGFLLVWVVQAAVAQRIAVSRSGRSSGAALLVALLPVAIVAQTSFWLIGGSTSSPSATFARYVSAWETRDPGSATALFATPRDATALAAAWASDDQAIRESVEAVAASNPEWDLDEVHPYANLRFVYHDGAAAGSPDRVVLDVEIVRLATVPTSFFGLFPSTRSETQPVGTIGQAVLVRRPSTALPFADASVWLIESVDLEGGRPAA